MSSGASRHEVLKTMSLASQRIGRVESDRKEKFRDVECTGILSCLYFMYHRTKDNKGQGRRLRVYCMDLGALYAWTGCEDSTAICFGRLKHVSLCDM